jgi:hypothetical protein
MALLLMTNFAVKMGWLNESDPNKIGWTDRSKTTTTWWSEAIINGSSRLLEWGNVTYSPETGYVPYLPRASVYYAVFSLRMAYTAATGGALTAAIFGICRLAWFLFGGTLLCVGGTCLRISECFEAVLCTLCCCCHCMGRCRRKHRRDKFGRVDAVEAAPVIPSVPATAGVSPVDPNLVAMLSAFLQFQQQQQQQAANAHRPNAS